MRGTPSLLAVLLLPLAAQFACTTAQTSNPLPAATPPNETSSLRQLTTPHFVMTTDASVEAATEMLQQAEEVYAEAAQVVSSLLPGAVLPKAPTTLVYFSTLTELSSLGAPDAAARAFFQEEQRLGEPAIFVYSGPLDNAALLRFRHGITAHLVRQQAVGARPWLVYGLAQYFATAQIDRDEAVLGAAPADFIFYHPKKLGRVSGPAFLNVLELPTVAELVAANPAPFVQAKQSVWYYAGAWMLVQTLLDPRLQYRAVFDRYLDGVSKGVASSDAFAKAAAENGAAIERAYREQLVENGPAAWRLHRSPAPRLSVEGRSLTPAEAALFWARIRPPTKDNQPLIEAALGKARALGADAAETEFLSAKNAEATGDWAAAEASLRRAAHAAPTVARYWFALGRVLSRREAAKPAGERKPEAVAEAAEPLQAIAQTAGEHAFVARHFAQMNQPEKGLPFAERALAILPNCSSCLDALAIIQFQLGSFDAAAALEARATSLLPEPDSDKGIAKRLREYQAAAKRGPGAPARSR